MNQNPKISIITICKNSESTISRCIDSVINQTYSNVEYIIIDGASTDNTMKIINNYRDRIDKIISESDKGIYDAMNKGIIACSGDYMLFLNSDDYLLPDSTVINIVNYIKANNESDIYYGKVLILNEETGNGNLWKAAKVSKFSLFRGALPHPATVYRTSKLRDSGMFDTSYKVAGDYEWSVRALLKHRFRFKSFDIIVAVFNKGGISTKKDFEQLLKEEKARVKQTYYSSLERKYYNFRWFLKKNFF